MTFVQSMENNRILQLYGIRLVEVVRGGWGKKKVSGGYVSYHIKHDDLMKIVRIKRFLEYISKEEKDATK